MYSERERKGATLATDRIQSFLKRPIASEIPVVDERLIMAAILKGVPVTLAERDRSKPLVKQLFDVAKLLSDVLNGDSEDPVADYNQIELRVSAHLAEDPGLVEAFTTGQDIHTTTSARVFSARSAQAASSWTSRANCSH